MQNTISLTTRLVVKPKSKSEMAGEYGVNRKTIFAWCTRIGINTCGRLLTVKQVAQIYEELGAPGSYQQQMTLTFQ